MLLFSAWFEALGDLNEEHVLDDGDDIAIDLRANRDLTVADWQ